MEHSWISCKAKTETVLEKQGSALRKDDVDVYRASVSLEPVPLKVLINRLSKPPRRGADLINVSSRTADILPKIADHLSLSFQIHERGHWGTVSEPKVEGDFYSFNNLLKNKLGTSFAETADVLAEFLICFREIVSLLWNVRRSRIALERLVDIGLVFVGFKKLDTRVVISKLLSLWSLKPDGLSDSNSIVPIVLHFSGERAGSYDRFIRALKSFREVGKLVAIEEPDITTHNQFLRCLRDWKLIEEAVAN